MKEKDAENLNTVSPKQATNFGTVVHNFDFNAGFGYGNPDCEMGIDIGGILPTAVSSNCVVKPKVRASNKEAD